MPKDWNKVKLIFKDTLQEIKEAQLTLSASSLAYTTLLSMVPLLAVSFALFKAFGGLDQLYGSVESFIFDNLAEGTDEQTLGLLQSFISNIHSSTLGFFGFAGLLLTSVTMLASIEKAINRIWKTPIQRNLFVRFSTYWMFITLGPIALASTLGILSSMGESAMQWLPSSFGVFIIFVAIFFGMYKWIPNRKVHWIPALVSACMTSLGWFLSKAAYQFYVQNFISYGKIYGSLAAIPILLIWIYLGWLVVLAGAALSASLQRRFEFYVTNKKTL